MGEVYRALDLRLGREVAVKLLPEAVASSPDRLARFEREARTVAGLNHPNIVTLFSVEDEDGVRFLTMELIDGQNLAELVTPGGLPLLRVLELSIPLADALVAAHERGVVHRDLKPANVMVTRENRVKVLDFGLSKSAEADALLDGATIGATAAAPLSGEGQVMGTVPYMAPEQIRGDVVDARSDLFAFGIILYELATGRRPFSGATSADVSSSILRDTPAPLIGVRGDLPGDLDRIVNRCLEKNPRERFQTALDVSNELCRIRHALEYGGRSSPATAAAKDVASVAVLPFVNRSRDEEDEYFSDGLADELLNVLAKIRGLRVAARTSSFQFKGKSEDLAVIGRKLNVATLVEGSVRKSGNRVRIAVQLVKVSDGFHLWSETYDRTLDDIFAVQDDIARSVVKELRTTLLGEAADSKASGEIKADVAAAAAGRGADPEAHRLFLQGRFLVNRAAKEDVERGIECLRRAVGVDPEHALAWASLSWADTMRGISGMSELHEAIARSRAAAGRSLALRPDLAEAHLALGSIQLWYDFDWKGAEASFGRALEVAPGNAVVLRDAGLFAFTLGKLDESLARCQRAVELDPLNAVAYSYVGRIHASLGRFDESEAAFRRALELSPDFSAGHLLLALTHAAKGRLDEALAEVKLEKQEGYRLQGLAIIHHARGERAESDAAIARLEAGFAESWSWQIATAYAARHEADAAFEWLENCYVSRDSGLAFLLSARYFRWLQSDPRWVPFLRRIGLGGS